MTCKGCHQESHQIHGFIDDNGYQEVCTQCANLSSSDAGVPDVFWNGRPYFSEALQCEFTSRSQKARVMKEKGVRELGNEKVGEKGWVEGSRDYRRKQFDKDRPKIKESFKRWKETGYARDK